MCKRGQTIGVITSKGKIVCVDNCIATIVRALNRAGIETVASCCGHGIRPGNIALEDGRELIIADDFEQAREVGKAFPPLSI